MRFFLRIGVLFLGLMSCAFAWNSIGHRLVAQIAYDQLTPQAKAKIDALTDRFFPSKYPEARFLQAAIWPDRIRSHTKAYDHWHYINYPVNKPVIDASVLQSENVVSEINRAESVLKNPQTTPQMKAMMLSFLIHLVGDIHQPLHCADLVNANHPEGDHGGNLYPIDADESTNLHGYWDRGLGLLNPNIKPYPFHYWQIESLANAWMQSYPRSYFGAKVNQISPLVWAQESHVLAAQYAYTLPENTKPSQAYSHQGQTIVKEQIVLAGYRLGDILNAIFNH